MATETVPVPVTNAVPEGKAAVEKTSVDISMTDKQRDKWLLTGKEPEDTGKVSEDKPEPKADEKAPPANAETATEPGTEAPPEQEPINKMGYGKLRARVKELETQLAAKQPAPKSDSKTETAQIEQPKPKAVKSRPEPQLEDKKDDGTPKYDTWEAYNRDAIKWGVEEGIREHEAAREKAQREATVAEQNKKLADSWNERIEKGSEKYTDLEDALDPEKGPGKLIQPGSTIDAWILDSDYGVDILHHFHVDRNDLKRIGAMHPIAAARELTKLETKLSGEPSKAPTAEAELKPEPKVTKAPPPARDIGGRGTTATDPVRKAVEDGDFEAYQAAANRKAIAASK